MQSKTLQEAVLVVVKEMRTEKERFVQYPSKGWDSERNGSYKALESMEHDLNIIARFDTTEAKIALVRFIEKWRKIYTLDTQDGFHNVWDRGHASAIKWGLDDVELLIID